MQSKRTEIELYYEEHRLSSKEIKHVQKKGRISEKGWNCTFKYNNGQIFQCKCLAYSFLSMKYLCSKRM